MQKIEHIGIAVRDLEEAEKRYAFILNVKPYKREAVESEGVLTSFFRAGPNKIELLQSTSEDSAIYRFIQKRGEGIHHIAFAVRDIEEEKQRFLEQGYRIINNQIKEGADNKMIFFLHPKDAKGVLIELCQDKEV